MRGTFKARGIEGALGYTSGGNEQVAVRLRIVEGDEAGHEITWHGYFTEKTTERTLESLRHLGWKGDDLFDLSGIDANDVSIVVEEEEYDGKLQSKVRWINAAGGLAMKERMSEGDAKRFAQRMKGAAVASRQKTQAPAQNAKHRETRAADYDKPPF